MSPRNVKNVVAGALIGTLLGSVSAILIPRQRKIFAQLNRPGWSQKAKDIGGRVYDEVRHWSEHEKKVDASVFVKGALLGLLVGAGAALLLTPKTGKQLRNNLAQGYQDFADKTQDIMDYVNHDNPIIKKKPARSFAKKPQASSKIKIKSKR